IGSDQQRCTQLAAVGQGQQPAIATAAQLLQAGVAEQTKLTVVQTVEQSVLYDAVLDDVTEGFGMHTGSGEVHAASTGAVPHAHVAIGRGPAGGDAFPGAEAFENALTGGRQGADPWFEGAIGGEGLDAEWAAIDHQNLQAT